MSSGSKSKPSFRAIELAVSFGDRFQHSDKFNEIFKEGMALVERTAAYLDTTGRRAAKRLEGTVAVAYATESMRLTTRLLEVASWLLIRRAVRDGEITEDEAAGRRQRVKLGSTGRPSHIKHWEDLPDDLRDLIRASFALQDRILQLDRAFAELGQLAACPQRNPVAAQIAMIETAFGEQISSRELN